MRTVQQITGYSEIQIKRMSPEQLNRVREDLTAFNNHTAAVLLDAVVQSNQTVMDCLCSLETLHYEMGYGTMEMVQYRAFLDSLLTK